MPAEPTERDERRFARLRWRCRRGMLENDLILTRFLDARGLSLNAGEVAALDRLLDLADSELWDLLAGRAEPADATLLPLLAELRAGAGGSPHDTKEPHPNGPQSRRRNSCDGSVIDRQDRCR
jgi:antitoxin CptB